MIVSKQFSITEIPVSRIREPKRRLRSEISEINNLASSIKRDGLLEPIVVRPFSSGYEVVAGCRRLSAFRHLKLYSIPCHVVEVDDQKALEISLVENVQHQSLNPIEEAIAYKRYVEEFGYGGVSDLATKIGKSQEYVSLRLALLRLPEEVIEKVISRQINPTTAQELLPLSFEQQRRLVDLFSNKKFSKNQIRSMVRQARRESSEGVGWLSTARGIGSVFERELEAIERSTSVLKTTTDQLSKIILTLPETSQVSEVLRSFKAYLNNQMDVFVQLKEERSVAEEYKVRV